LLLVAAPGSGSPRADLCPFAGLSELSYSQGVESLQAHLGDASVSVVATFRFRAHNEREEEISMRKRLGQCLVAAAALLIGTAAASAEEGFARAATNLRAGPDADYPVITGVGPGEPVFVYGCLSDYSWCDVRARRVRGWMQASRIELVYGGRRVLVQSYAPRIGVPVVRFDIGTYWDRNYRNYDWYEDRGRYDRRFVDRPRNFERREFDRYDRDVRRDPRQDFERDVRRESPPVVTQPPVYDQRAWGGQRSSPPPVNVERQRDLGGISSPPVNVERQRDYGGIQPSRTPPAGEPARRSAQQPSAGKPCNAFVERCD
jgi:uncharacterized protein YraI